MITRRWHHHLLALLVLAGAATTVMYLRTIVWFLFWAPLVLMIMFFNWIGQP